MFRDSREDLNRQWESVKREESRVIERGKYVCDGVPGTYMVKSINGSAVNVEIIAYYDKDFVSWLNRSSMEKKIKSFFYWKFPHYIIKEWRISAEKFD